MKTLRTFTFVLFALAMTLSISSCKKEPVVPMTVTTNDITEIGPTSAKFSATVKGDDGRVLMSRGFVYSSLHSPTASDSGTYGGNSMPDYVDYVGYLTPNTTYRVRAILTDNDYNQILGNERSFTTLP
jgi:hypothetical protein